jgi:hypothetical protein
MILYWGGPSEALHVERDVRCVTKQVPCWGPKNIWCKVAWWPGARDSCSDRLCLQPVIGHVTNHSDAPPHCPHWAMCCTYNITRTQLNIKCLLLLHVLQLAYIWSIGLCKSLIATISSGGRPGVHNNGLIGGSNNDGKLINAAHIALTHNGDGDGRSVEGLSARIHSCTIQRCKLVACWNQSTRWHLASPRRLITNCSLDTTDCGYPLRNLVLCIPVLHRICATVLQSVVSFITVCSRKCTVTCSGEGMHPPPWSWADP